MKICNHQQNRNCICSISALEPHDNCPIHGYPWPPRCCLCNQFLSWKTMKEEHIKSSNAGQTTPGLGDLYYHAYKQAWTPKNRFDQPLTKEQWTAQYRMLHCQILGEG